MKRPAGITFVAVVAVILGLAQIGVALGYFNIASLEFLEVSWLRGDVASISSNVLYATGAGLALLGVLGIAYGIGALGVRAWAWTLGVATYLLGIAGSVVMLFVTQTALTAAVTGIVSALMAWYLSTQEVREAFGQESATAGGQRPHAV